jgi:hypothetical protein
MNEIDENKMLSLLLKAAGAADQKKNDMNEIKAKLYNEKSWAEYEATYKAMLYHELLNNGLNFSDISMENGVAEEYRKGKLERAKFDLWIEYGEKTLVLEVKLFGDKDKNRGLYLKTEKRGIYTDLKKLSLLISDGQSDGTDCVALAIYEGKKFTELRQLESYIAKEIRDLLSDHLKLMICSGGKCEFVGDRGDFEGVKNIKKEQYLEELGKIKKGFNGLLETYKCLPKNDWRIDRISRLLDHLTQLETLIQSNLDIPNDIVDSDIRYFKENLNGLELVLEPEKKK